MKKSNILLMSCFSFLLTFHLAGAQGDKALRPSPPAEVTAMIDSAKVTINYSAPAVKGRDIWGGLVPYNQVWRTGANEATYFETSGDLTINGQPLAAGKYGLFTIPGEKVWTIIFNSVWDQWGSFKYDASKDVLRVVTPSEKSASFNERMKFEITDHNVTLLWENLKVRFDVNAK